jgi:hypothetical protein
VPKGLKRAVALLLIAALCLPLGACWDSIELSSQIFAVNLGLDSGKNLALRMTMELPRISRTGTGSGTANSNDSSGAGDPSLILNDYVLVQVEGNTIIECLNALRVSVPRSVSLVKLMGIYISESFVHEGILFDTLTALIQPHQIRPMAYVYVCKGRAEDALRIKEPSFGMRLSKSIVAEIETLKRISVLAYEPLIQFYNRLLDGGGDAYAITVAVNNAEFFSQPGGRDGEQPLDYGPGNVPANSPIPLDTLGTAIFHNDHIVLFLNAYETQLFNLGLGEFITADLNVNDATRTLQIQIGQLNHPNLKVDNSGERLIVYLDVYLRASSYVGTFVDGRDLVCARVRATLENDLTDLLLRIQQTGADPLNIVGRVQKGFWTKRQFDEYGWSEKYKNAGFVVKVHLAYTSEAMVAYS